MAPYNFEGEFADITEQQLEFINEVIEEQGFKGSKVTFEAVGSAADNYAANVKRIVIEGENGSLTMIAKIAPTNEMFRKNLNAHIMFGNEHTIYTEVLPKFLKLQIEAEVPETEQIKFPICYGSSIEAPNEVVLLEDLKPSGFIMLDRFKSLSNECVKSILKNLALYHSLSHVLKRKEPETYNEYKNKLGDMWGEISKKSPEELAYFQHAEDMSLAMLDDPEHKNIMRHKIADVLTLAAKMSKFEDGSKYAVIQHGDCWTNNIMFKFEDDVLKQSMLIDYQISKNSSPAHDLLYVTFNCTDYETRFNHYYEWLDYYYSELDRFLSNFDLRANFVYPRDQLDADIKRYARLGFGFSCLISGVLTIKAEQASKLKETFQSENVSDMMNAMSDLPEDTMGLFKARLVGLVKSYVELGLLS